MAQPAFNIAIMPNVGLGDALVYMLLADNLRPYGQVTIYHNLLYKLKNIFPDYHIAPALTDDNKDSICQQQDLCIAHKDITNRLFDHYPYSNLVEFNSDKTPTQLNHLYVEQQKDPLLKTIHQYSGLNLSHNDLSKTVVDNITSFLREQLQLPQVNKHIKVCESLAQTAKQDIIVIHPDSSVYKKNWAPKKYLQLAKQLKQQGENVVFSVAPNEYDKWQTLLQRQFPLTQHNLEELAYQLKAAKCFIGSDSGPGHLASLLGTPTLTVFARKRKHYTWRPGWAKGAVAYPIIKVNFITTPTHLRSWLTVNRVLRRFALLS